jgi:hypothetical protein
MSAAILTKFTVNLLDAKQNIETVQWRVLRRAKIGEVEIESEATEDDYRSIADVIQLGAGLGHREIQVVQKAGGRVIVREAAFGKPILEFDPTGAD